MIPDTLPASGSASTSQSWDRSCPAPSSPTGKGYLDLAGRPPFQPFSLEKALPRDVRGPVDFLALLALAASSLGVRTGGLRRDMARPFPRASQQYITLW